MTRVMLLPLLLAVCAETRCINLHDLTTITLRAGYYTTSVPGVPQLTCTSTSTCKSALSRVTCENRGFNGTEIAWHCYAYGPHPGVIVHFEKVACQPCDGGMVNGSCSIKYSISYNDNNLEAEWISTFFCIFILLIVFMMLIQ